MVLAVTTATPAVACTRNPAEYERETKAYAASVTSVYRARAEDFTPVSTDYPDDAFSVRIRSIETIWGEVPPGPIQLEFEPGACVEWFFPTEDQKPFESQTYFVFYAPSAMKDLSLLRVYPDNGQPSAAAMEMLEDMKVRGPGRPEPRHFGSPAIWITAVSFLLLLL
jgi:hypothetical protein